MTTWTSDNLNIFTGTTLDPEGYGIDGFDENGYNRHGNDADGNEGIQFDCFADSYDFDAYDCSGVDYNGINRRGFLKYGDQSDSPDEHRTGYLTNQITGTQFDELGFDQKGWNVDGTIHMLTGTDTNPSGRSMGKRDYDAVTHWSDRGIHFLTGTEYDEDGYDREGFDAWRIHRITDEEYDEAGYDVNGDDREGFKSDGWAWKYDRQADRSRRTINKSTGTAFDPAGYDGRGFDTDGYDRNGLDVRGFDSEGYRADGYDDYGYDRNGFNSRKLDREGYMANGYNRQGWNRENLHKRTGGLFNERGLTAEFMNADGMLHGRDTDIFGWTEADGAPKHSDKFDYLQNLLAKRFIKSSASGKARNMTREGWVRTVAQGWNRETARYDLADIFTHKKTGTRWNPEGFDYTGLNADGMTERAFHGETSFLTILGIAA